MKTNGKVFSTVPTLKKSWRYLHHSFIEGLFFPRGSMPSLLHAQNCPRRSQTIHYIIKPSIPKRWGPILHPKMSLWREYGLGFSHQISWKKRTKGPARYLRPWVSRLPPGCERMEAWVDIVKQVCRFFRGSSFFFIFFSPGRFHSPYAQAKLFEMCKWSRDDDINELLHLIQAHADAARVVRERCKTKRWIKKKILEMRSKSGCFYLKAVRSEGGSRGCQFWYEQMLYQQDFEAYCFNCPLPRSVWPRHCRRPNECPGCMFLEGWEVFFIYLTRGAFTQSLKVQDLPVPK